jgi:dynein heavy chain
LYPSHIGKLYGNTIRIRRPIIGVNNHSYILTNKTIVYYTYNINICRDVVRLERPDLEEKRTQTIVSINTDNNLLKEMEDKTLRMLNMAKGNILDDEELIETLNNSKVY